MSSSAPCAPSKRMRAPARAALVEQRPDRIHERQHSVGDGRQLGEDRVGRRSPALRGRAAGHCGARAAARSSAAALRGRQGPSAGWRGGRPCPRRPARCRGPSCRSWRRAQPPPRASRSSSRCSDRISGALSATRRFSGVTATPCPCSFSISAISACGSSTTPLPMIDELARPHDAGGQQAQLEGDAVDDRAYGRHYGRPGSAPRRRRAPTASRRSFPCPRRPIASRRPPHSPSQNFFPGRPFMKVEPANVPFVAFTSTFNCPV